MNMSVPEACDVDSREKWDVTLSNKYFFEPFFCDFLQKNLAYEKLNPYICRYVMEYPLVGGRKTYLLLRGTTFNFFINIYPL